VGGADRSATQPFIQAVSRIIQLVYAPATELLVRAPRTIPTDLASRSYYRSALVDLMSRGDDPIRNRIGRQIRDANVREYMRYLRPQEARFLNRLLDTDFQHPSVPYLVNFIDYKDAPLFLSKMIIERIADYDTIEINQMLHMIPTGAGDYWSQVVRLNPVRGDAMRNYQQWLNSVGSFLFLIWDTNRSNEGAASIFNTCLTRDFFESSPELSQLRDRSDLAILFRYLKSSGDPKQLYQCILDGLLGGRLQVPDGSDGRVTYLIRMTTSVSFVW
jgi:hypothetical protein